MDKPTLTMFGTTYLLSMVLLLALNNFDVHYDSIYMTKNSLIDTSLSYPKKLHTAAYLEGTITSDLSEVEKVRRGEKLGGRA